MRWCIGKCAGIGKAYVLMMKQKHYVVQGPAVIQTTTTDVDART